MTQLSLSSEQKQHLKTKLHDYFDQELEQELAEFDADFLLDFISEQFGSYFYNKGLQDAQAVLLRRMDDIAESIEEIELVTEVR